MPSLETILAVVTALVGWPALVALTIDVLKYFGVVDSGTAGKWNICFNLLGFVGVAVLLGFFPQVNIAGVDAVILNYVTIAAYVFGMLVQMGGAKLWHGLFSKSTTYRSLYK